MPSVYASTNKQIIEKQVKAILECIDLADAHVRYMKEEYREILQNGEDLQVNYINHLTFDSGPESRATAIAALKPMIDEFRRTYLHDLNHKRRIRSMLQDLLDGKTDGVEIVFQLITNMCTSRGCSEISFAFIEQKLEHARQEYATAQRLHGNKPDVMTAAKIKLDQALTTANFQRRYVLANSDLAFNQSILEKLTDLVFKAETDRNLCATKVSYYICFSFNPGTYKVDVGFSDEFSALIADNINKYKEVMRRIAQRHSIARSTYPDYADGFVTDAQAYLMQNGIVLPAYKQCKTQEELYAIYRSQCNFQDLLFAFDQQDAQSVEADLANIKEQQTTSIQPQAPVIATTESIAKPNPELDVLAKQKELEDALQARARADEMKKAEKARIELERTRRKQEREARNARLEEERRNIRQSRIAVRPLKTTDDSTIEVSRFTVSMDLVQANAKDLLELFDENTKKYRYSDVVTLVQRLGGRVDEGSGSHKCIYFSDAMYQSFQEWQGEEKDPKPAQEAKASIAKPHGKAKGSAFVYNHNLRLVRNAINQVLPPDWKLLLQAAIVRKKSSLKA